MLWTQKHKPTFEQIPHETKQIHDFTVNYAKQKKKALLLHGPTGTGKTSAIHALARKLGLELIEVNASDYRTADEINTKIGNAVKQQSLFGTSKLIFVDELDGIAGNEDRGGVTAIVDIIKDSKYPIILAANDPWNSKFNTLRTKSTLIEFPALTMTTMTPVLQQIATKENIKTEEIILKTLARRSGGDLRGAITDLQTLAQINALTTQGLETLHDREHSETIMQALVKILKSTDASLAVSALDLVDEDIDEAFLWIDENMPKEYTNPADLARAYQILSKADVFRGRIRKWQYWRYLAYVSTLITAGIATAKDKKPTNFVQYGRTQRLLKIWMANQKYNRRKRVATKLGIATHCSTKKALQETLPYIHYLYQKKHTSADKITEELKLDEEELEWLNK